MAVYFCSASLWPACRYAPVTAPENLAANRQGAPLDWGGRLLGGAVGVSLYSIVPGWRLAAFNETFMMLAALCALTLLAEWLLHEDSAAQSFPPKS